MTSRWRPTSEDLIGSLRHQPLLVVLRPREPILAAPLLARLETLGLVHAEIAWQRQPNWTAQCRELVDSFPALRLGAASICHGEALTAAANAGFRYAMAPILRSSLLRQAEAQGMTLVPGVMTPTETHRAMALGCRVVKLFPAAALGAGYWKGLRDPLGGTLPFCIAAGGLRPEDVTPWLREGVDALALGSQRLGWGESKGEDAVSAPCDDVAAATLRDLLAKLAR